MNFAVTSASVEVVFPPGHHQSLLAIEEVTFKMAEACIVTAADGKIREYRIIHSEFPLPPNVGNETHDPVKASSNQLSAAQKVFGLPELLDDILIHVSSTPQDKREEIDGPESGFPYANQELYTLQRVNSTFQATIRNSKTCQQRMWLASHAAESTDADPYCRISWFGRFVRVIDGDHGLRISYVREHERCFRPEGRMAECEYRIVSRQGTIDRYSEDSWRKMKLHCIANGDSLRLDLRNEGGPEALLATFAYEDGTTLGQLYDGLKKLTEDIKENWGEWADFHSLHWDQCWWEDDSDGVGAASLQRVIAQCARGDMWK